MQDVMSAEKKARILIVERELIIARDIQKRLRSMGYSVIDGIPSHEEAALKAATDLPDLILMDINPRENMYGIEAAEKIRSQLDVPVIYIATDEDAEYLNRARITEPFAYIVKPFQDSGLRSGIEFALYKHRMENRLRQSEQWLATTLQNIGDAIVATDVSGVLTYMNSSAESLVGWQREEALGGSLSDVFHFLGEKTDIVTAEITRKVVVEGETVIMPGDAKLLTKSGEEVPIEAKAMPIVGDTGTIMGMLLVLIDITERRRVEEALQRSERLLALKNLIASIFLTTPDEEMFGVVVEVVLKAMKCRYGLFGYIDENGELVIPSMTREVWSECRIQEKKIMFPKETWGGLWGRALRERKLFSGKGPFPVPDGHIHIHNFLASPIVYHRQAIGLISVANKETEFDEKDRELLEALTDRIAPILQARLERDRQERKRVAAEHALQQSKNLLQRVFDSIPDLLSVIDRDFRIVLSNWHGGYEYVPQQLREKQPYCHEAYYGINKTCDPCHTKEVFRTGRSVFLEKYNPKIGYLEVRAFPILDEEDNVLLVAEHIRDITERKRAADALAEEKERLAVTLRSIGDGVITADIEGKVVLLNKAAEELTGWRQEEAAGKPFQEVFRIVNEKNRELCKSPVDQVLATGGCVELANHTLLIGRRGVERSIADSAAPIRDSESRLIGVVLVFRDITEKNKMEEELFNARKLESIGILAGGIAHDFNNLLTAILGNLSLSKMLVPEEEALHQRLAEAEKASLRARDLTQQLLTFSRGGAPVRRIASIAGIIKNTTTFTLSGSHVSCRFFIPDDLYPVEVDEGQISQVINNLVINADQAMPGGGEIEISCANVSIDAEQFPPLPAGTYILVSVKDQGGGIPEDVLPRIFDPYFSTKETGKGLGLATVYSIVKNHDGHISATSRRGTGTTFNIYLPAAVAGVVEQTVEEIATPTGKGKILVMDDEEIILDIAGEMLSYLGYDAEFAHDGEEAVKLCQLAVEARHPFSAVLMDLTIPGGMGGKDAIKLLRKTDENVKAIVSSGYSNDPIMADYRAFGFQGVITKPYKVAELKKILDEVVGNI